MNVFGKSLHSDRALSVEKDSFANVEKDSFAKFGIKRLVYKNNLAQQTSITTIKHGSNLVRVSLKALANRKRQ
jgi:hypothetical protein